MATFLNLCNIKTTLYATFDKNQTIICYHFRSICYILDETDPEGEIFPSFEIQMCLEVSISTDATMSNYLKTLDFFNYLSLPLK